MSIGKKLERCGEVEIVDEANVFGLEIFQEDRVELEHYPRYVKSIGCIYLK